MSDAPKGVYTESHYLCAMSIGLKRQDTIVAVATPSGEGAIGVIRLSGEQAIAIADKHFVGRKRVEEARSHSLLVGRWEHEHALIDEVVISLYRGPRSYTGEDVVEISCHGSSYIIRQIVEQCILAGARAADRGEYTLRAFLHGKLDLSQAESVADIIAADTRTQHEMALGQMRGGYSECLRGLRDELIEFAGLIELELDFSEEDVEFANREKLFALIAHLQEQVKKLIDSFALGNVLKEGIPVAIIGEPNVGKSTLLNALLNEERALVSDIAGTTRDFIEDTLRVGGVLFRFIDTAGIRSTEDVLETKGIERTFEKLRSARIILYLCDIREDYRSIVAKVKELKPGSTQKIIVLLNKMDTISVCDAYDIEEAVSVTTQLPALALSAVSKDHTDKLLSKLVSIVEEEKMQHDGFMVSNIRHVDALNRTLSSLQLIEKGMRDQLPGDLLSVDIRMALHSLGEITGSVELDRDILGTIFGKFCIGK